MTYDGSRKPTEWTDRTIMGRAWVRDSSGPGHCNCNGRFNREAQRKKTNKRRYLIAHYVVQKWAILHQSLKWSMVKRMGGRWLALAHTYSQQTGSLRQLNVGCSTFLDLVPPTTAFGNSGAIWIRLRLRQGGTTTGDKIAFSSSSSKYLIGRRRHLPG